MIRVNKRAYTVLISTFLVLFISTLLAWWVTKQVVIRRINEVFLEQVTTIESWITNRLEFDKTIIYGLQGYWASSEIVTEEEWNIYIKSLKIEERFQGITSISYARRVNGSYIVTYVYPIERTAAIGFDLTSEEKRLSTLNKAIDEDVVGISDRVSLAADKSPGFIMVAPLYSTLDVPDDLVERRFAVDGVVIIAFKSESAFKDIFGQPDPFPSLDFELYKGKVLEEDHMLYDHDYAYYIRKGENLRRLETKRTILVNGETLTLLVASKPSFRLSEAERNLPLFILIGGFIVSVSIFVFFYQRVLNKQMDISEKLPQLKTKRNRD